MANTGAPWNLPYPIGTDRVMDGDNAIQALSDRIDALFDNTWVRSNVPPSSSSVSLGAGWGGLVQYGIRGGWVWLYMAPTKSSWAGYEVIATLPTEARPSAAVFQCGVITGTGAPTPLVVNPSGTVTSITGTAAGANGINASLIFPLPIAAPVVLPGP